MCIILIMLKVIYNNKNLWGLRLNKIVRYNLNNDGNKNKNEE